MDAVFLLMLITLGKVFPFGVSLVATDCQDPYCYEIYEQLCFIYVVSNNVGPNELHDCDYGCNVYDVPICARNEACTLRFVGKCTMDMYNCLYPHKAFHQIEDSKCGDTWTPECTYEVARQ